MVLFVAASPHLLGHLHQGLQVFPLLGGQVIDVVDGAILTLAALTGGADPQFPVELVRVYRGVSSSEHGALEPAVADVEADLFEGVLDAVTGAWSCGLGRLYGKPYPLEQGGLLRRRASRMLQVDFPGASPDRLSPWKRGLWYDRCCALLSPING